MFVPLEYNLRSLLVRRASTILTVLGIGATVAIVAGVLSLQQGFAAMFADQGREDLVVLLRPGASTEGLSGFSREGSAKLVKSTTEIDVLPDGSPAASLESFLAVRRNKLSGGETNVPIRGVQPATFALRESDVRIIEGRAFTPGADELIVGRRLVGRIVDCQIGDVVVLDVTPFKVVGVFEADGAFESEIWGDFERMIQALGRDGPNRILARLRPEARDEAGVRALSERLEEDREAPARVMTEREYLTSQTDIMSGILIGMGTLLAVIMGLAAVFTATNTMLTAIASRTHEIGILLSTGFRPLPLFVSFLFEALVLGLLGGLAGCLMVLPLHGLETGTTNFESFTEVAFAFQVTPAVLTVAVVFSLALGLIGGAIPAFKAARLRPARALRRH